MRQKVTSKRTYLLLYLAAHFHCANISIVKKPNDYFYFPFFPCICVSFFPIIWSLFNKNDTHWKQIKSFYSFFFSFHGLMSFHGKLRSKLCSFDNFCTHELHVEFNISFHSTQCFICQQWHERSQFMWKWIILLKKMFVDSEIEPNHLILK